jgi:hypothetical protein
MYANGAGHVTTAIRVQVQKRATRNFFDLDVVLEPEYMRMILMLNHKHIDPYWFSLEPIPKLLTLQSQLHDGYRFSLLPRLI